MIPHHLIFLLILFACFPIYSMCDYIPTSFSDAESALENEEIDSICFIRYRTLILYPVNPVYEGWRDLLDLNYELDNREFPSPVALLEYDGDKKAVLRDYPWLSPYSELFTLTADSTSLPVSVNLKSDVIANLDEKSRAGVKLNVQDKTAGSKGELGLSVYDQDIYPSLRQVYYVSPRKKVSFALGNYVLPKNSMIHGAFEYYDRDTSHSLNWLYGTRRSWNGAAVTVQGNNLTLSSMAHARYDEKEVNGKIEYDFSKLGIGFLGSYQERSDSQSTVLQFTCYSNRGIIQTTYDAGNGIALLGNYSIDNERWNSEGDIWFMSSGYAPLLSQKREEMQKELGRDTLRSSAIGCNIRTYYTVGKWKIGFRFNGAILDGRGKSEKRLSIRRTDQVSFGVHNRLLIKDCEREVSQLWEQKGDVIFAFMQKALQIPIYGNNVIEQGRWKRSAMDIGVKLRTERGILGCEWYQKWYAVSASQYGVRSSLSHRLGKHGRGALLLTLPLEHHTAVTLQSVVEFSI